MQALNGKTTGSSLTAAEWNQLPTEVQNVITSAGLALSAGDLTQLVKSVATYVAAGTFYTDGGSANAYVLSNVGSLVAPDSYHEGMEVRFIPDNNNTGASTINVAGLGVVDILDLAGSSLSSGQLVTTQVYTLFYSTLYGGDFLLVPVNSGFDITGLVSALPTTNDTGPFFDDSAAGNRKASIWTLGNRTWEHFSLPTGSTTINTNDGYEKAYIRTNTSSTSSSITVNDSTTAELVGTSFLVHNGSGQDGGIVSVNRQTTGVFQDGFNSGLTQVILYPGQSALFYRNANNSYVVMRMDHLVFTMGKWWQTNLTGISGTDTFDNSGASNYLDYRRYWDKRTTGAATLEYTALGSVAGMAGTSFVVANNASSGNLEFDITGMTISNRADAQIDLDQIEPGEAYLFFRTSDSDTYAVWPLARRSPLFATFNTKPSSTTYNSDTTLSDDPHLQASLLYAGLYQFEAVIGVSGNTTSDYKFNLNVTGPGAITTSALTYQLFGEDNAIGDIEQQGSWDIGAGNIVILTAGGGGSHTLKIQGYIQVDDVVDVDYQAAQNTSDPGNTTTLAGSWMKITPLYNRLTN